MAVAARPLVGAPAGGFSFTDEPIQGETPTVWTIFSPMHETQ